MKSVTGFILYIDILGYKNMLRNYNSGDHDKTKRLLERFTEIYTKVNYSLTFGNPFDDSKLLRRFFSDNFLFVYESDREDYNNLVAIQSIASHIQSQFLCCGILTRGSITYGPVDYSKDIVYGLDLIKAVELEESHPEPSVIVGEDLENVLIANKHKYNKHNSLFFVYSNSERDLLDVKTGIEKYLKELNKGCPDKKTIEKIGWVIEQVNEYFPSTKRKYRLTISSQVKLIFDDRIYPVCYIVQTGFFLSSVIMCFLQCDAH